MSEKEHHEASRGGLAYVLREGQNAYPLHILMLHGWSGNERVMWVLESVLPEEAPAASLRGRFALNGGSYQWTEARASIKTKMGDFAEAVSAVEQTLTVIAEEGSFDAERLVLMGFSQGAALCFALAESLDTPPKALIALAAYYPEGEPNRITEIPVYWGHGLQDELVPIERARRDVDRLKEQGADVHFCETDVGHKLGIECTRGLKTWLRGLEN